MEKKQLDARKKGACLYDDEHDILMFKTKGRDYAWSLEYDEFVLDIDTKGFVTGIRIFDATKVFDMTKEALKHVKNFIFKTKIEDKVLRVLLKFTSLREKKPIEHSYGFERDVREKINDVEVVCSVVQSEGTTTFFFAITKQNNVLTPTTNKDEPTIHTGLTPNKLDDNMVQFVLISRELCDAYKKWFWLMWESAVPADELEEYEKNKKNIMK